MLMQGVIVEGRGGGGLKKAPVEAMSLESPAAALLCWNHLLLDS